MRYYLPLLLLFSSLLSCGSDSPIIDRVDPDVVPENPNVDVTTQLVDIFASYTLEEYYLWIDDPGRLDLIEAVFDPDTCYHPKAALSKVLSKEDRWTELLDNMTETKESFAGTETSTGMEVIPYLLDKTSRRIFFVVTCVHPGSPADLAGIKRGDVFNKMDGQYLTSSNYKLFYSNSSTMILTYAEIIAGSHLQETDRTITIKPVKAYLEPVIMTKVFDINGEKKVGYLNYVSFTDSVSTLISAFEDFKNQGVSELVVDLRYNGGGYISTCTALASMMAPKSVIENEEVFITNIYNQMFTEYYEKYYSLSDNFEKKYIDLNLELKKIYFLVSAYTASASEALIVGLSPYCDVTLIGEKTHGKFCSGMLVTPDYIFIEDFYKQYKNEFKDWGMYVMVGTFGDKNGYNGSRPDGFTPNTIIEDDPFDGYEFGDPRETLLREALEQAGMKIRNYDYYAPTRATKASLSFEKLPEEKPGYTIRTMDKNMPKHSTRALFR